MKERDRLSALKQHSAAPVEEKPEKQAANVGGSRKVAKSGFERRLMQAGIGISPKIYKICSILFTLVIGFMTLFLGPLFSLFFMLFLIHFFFFAYLEERAVKRKRQVIPQLAPFIDGIASALGTGFNIEGAIIQAAEGVPAGLLRSELNRVCHALNGGLSVKEAMSILRERICGSEVTSLCVAITLFASMGGHVLEPFRRLARKIREQQAVVDKAARDLVMVKQAFYILFFLALGAPGVLMMIQPNYLKDAYFDGLGRVILQVGAILVLAAYIFFKRMINLKI